MEKRRQQFITGVEQCCGHSECNLLYYMFKYTKLKEQLINFSLQFHYLQAYLQRPSQASGEKSNQGLLLQLREIRRHLIVQFHKDTMVGRRPRANSCIKYFL